MIIDDINEIPSGKIKEFINNNDHSSIFYTPEMYDFFQRTKKWSPVFLAIKNEDNDILGIVQCVIQHGVVGPLRYFTSRTVVFGGPVIAPMELEVRKEICARLLKTLIQKVGKRTIYIQFRNFFDMKEFASVFEKLGFQFREHLNFIVKISDRKKTEANMSNSKMRQVKKSLKTGVKVIESHSLDQVEQFYYILKALYKKKVKKPLPDWDFFKLFFECSNRGLLGKYLLVQYQNKIIGGIMCPITENRCIYEWFVCGLDGQFKGIYPSVLATWAAIDYALTHNIKYFDFLGAGKPDQDYGVREFKSRFGGELVNFGRYERINNRILYRLGSIGVRVLGALKG
jgi:lipid II:glycine glycyltransferase (peptidoglycan interpeptide bridge formation enzyme)